MDFKGLIEEYIDKKVTCQKEKELVRKLFLVDLKKQMKKEEFLYDISLESLQVREEYRLKISDRFYDLLNSTKKSKEHTQRRLVLFSEYLKKDYKVDLVLDELIKRESINPYERLVDLLKTLNEGMTKQELMDHYAISRKPLERDIDELIMGTKILGQRVKIRDIQRVKTNDDNRGKYELAYQSTIHPIFIPLNLSEVYYLIMGLKFLSKEHGEFASETYDYLANRVYCQLSDYAKKKIKRKGMEIGIQFPSEDEFERYNGSMDEEKMAARNKESNLMYLWKAGVKCTIHLNNDDMEVIKDCYVHYDMDNREIYLKSSLHGERKRKVDISQILHIEYDYK